MATPASTTDSQSDARAWQVLAEGFTLFAAGAAPVFSIIQAIGTLTGDPVVIEVATDPGRTLDVGGTALPLDSAFVEVLPTTTQAWVLAGVDVASGLFVALVAWLVYRVLVTARTEPGPFRGGMATRIFRISGLVMAGGMALSVLSGLPNLLLTPDGAGLTVSLSFLPLFVAAAIAWTAEVFRRGEALESDLSGLV